MMKVTRVLACAVIAASAFIFDAEAQNRRGGVGPAEQPPSSFNGRQFVDSQGCVFIRAGINGNVTWVPRVDRQRRPLCNQKPTALTTQIAAAPATRPAPAPAPAPAAAPRTAAAPTPAPTPRAAPAPARAQQVVRTRPQPTQRTQVRPRVVQIVPPTPAPTAAPVQTARTVTRAPASTGICRPGDAIRQGYDSAGNRVMIRCNTAVTQRSTSRTVATAPQTSNRFVRPTTPAPVATSNRFVRPTAPVTTRTARVSQNARVLPSQVFDQRLTEHGANRVPKGFRPAWEDDRLNPRRAEQSLRGVAQTRLIWTQTVPRRLIDQSTGRDVTATVALVYPYTDMATQQRDLGTVTLVQRNGQLVKRIVRNSRARATAATRTPTVSTRSAPVAQPKPVQTTRAKPQATSGGRYIQVGTFGVAANAQATARRLQSAGLPVRMSNVTRGGQRLQIVLAGPFGSSQGLNNGLNAARSLGFRDAFVR